jgi:tripartite-type tricarboxylate transporter receptor subunit TctC
MELPRRSFLQLGESAAAFLIATRIALALDYPTRPVRIIVGFAPASGPDIVARLMGQRLSERFGQQFIVEDRPGAGGSIATQTVVNAPGDGYTLLLATSANAINATLYSNLNFNFVRDVVPIASVSRALCDDCQSSCSGARNP